MKLLNLSILFLMLWGFDVNAHTSIQKNQALQLLVNNCPVNCSSCWEQCTKDDDCGVDHKCISSACGNRCVKNVSE